MPRSLKTFMPASLTVSRMCWPSGGASSVAVEVEGRVDEDAPLSGRADVPGSAAMRLRASATATYGTDARKTVNGQMVMWAGNVFRDGAVSVLKYIGTSNDRDPILTALGGSTPTAIASGYMREDVNMTGQVKYTGAANDRDPILVNIGGTVPTNTRSEQLP